MSCLPITSPAGRLHRHCRRSPPMVLEARFPSRSRRGIPGAYPRRGRPRPTRRGTEGQPEPLAPSVRHRQSCRVLGQKEGAERLGNRFRSSSRFLLRRRYPHFAPRAPEAQRWKGNQRWNSSGLVSKGCLKSESKVVAAQLANRLLPWNSHAPRPGDCQRSGWMGREAQRSFLFLVDHSFVRLVPRRPRCRRKRAEAQPASPNQPPSVRACSRSSGLMEAEAQHGRMACPRPRRRGPRMDRRVREPVQLPRPVAMPACGLSLDLPGVEERRRLPAPPGRCGAGPLRPRTAPSVEQPEKPASPAAEPQLA